MKLSDHTLQEIRELPPKYPHIRSAVMPALDLAQEELGMLTQEAMTQVAQALQVDPGYVEGVATFYSLFHLEPVGKHHLYVCNNLSCQLRGAEELLAHIKQSIGVSEYGQVSADELFSVEPVECLGACEYAPMLRADHRFHYDLTPAKIDALLKEWRGSGDPREARREAQPLRPKSRAAARGRRAESPAPNQKERAR